jgi:hypothetical protein
MPVSRKSATIFDQGTIPESSTPYIGKGVALVALTATLVYIYARIPQIAVNQRSFYAAEDEGLPDLEEILRRAGMKMRTRMATAMCDDGEVDTEDSSHSYSTVDCPIRTEGGDGCEAATS